jgi:hypothetical protein
MLQDELQLSALRTHIPNMKAQLAEALAQVGRQAGRADPDHICTCNWDISLDIYMGSTWGTRCDKIRCTDGMNMGLM